MKIIRKLYSDKGKDTSSNNRVISNGLISGGLSLGISAGIGFREGNKYMKKESSNAMKDLKESLSLARKDYKTKKSNIINSYNNRMSDLSNDHSEDLLNFGKNYRKKIKRTKENKLLRDEAILEGRKNFKNIKETYEGRKSKARLKRDQGLSDSKIDYNEVKSKLNKKYIDKLDDILKNGKKITSNIILKKGLPISLGVAGLGSLGTLYYQKKNKEDNTETKKL